MAINPNLSLQANVPDFGQALSQGLATGEAFGTSNIREQLLNQRAQAGELSLQQSQQNQAMQGMQNFANVVDGLSNIPDLAQRAKILAQQTPMLKEAGIPVNQLTSMDLSDSGLRGVQASLRPFMSKMQNQQSAPAEVQSFQYYNSILGSADATDEQKQAAKIALKLEGPAKTFTPKVVDIGGAKYLQVGNEFFNPSTMAPVATNAQGIPVAGGQAQELTPEKQVSMKAEEAAAITTAKESAKLGITEGSTEAVEMQAKKLAQSQNAINVVDNIIGSDRLDNITGLTGRIPFSSGNTNDLLGEVQQLKSMLTAENLGIMTGVLSESDMKVIEGISNDIKMVTDETGNVMRIDGSYEGTVNKLKSIKREMINGLNRKGHYVEGQTSTNPNTGDKIIMRNGQWSKM